MGDTVVVYMQAYNAEHTLRRALDSMLHQTYSNWIIYLVDNGSTDKTGEIADKYAQCDSRIICRHVFPNNVWFFYCFIDKYLREPLGNYFAWLDADDEYKPEFLSEAMSFVKSNKLGICVCGTNYIDSLSGKILRNKCPSADFIIHDTGFSKYFLDYRRFLDVMWGKVYSLPVMQSVDYQKIPRIKYAPDSVVVLELFKKCYKISKPIGFLSKSLHCYYRSGNTLSLQFSMEFINDIHIYYDELVRYLKCFGKISDLNMDYLFAIWLGWTQDIFIRVCKADLPILQKLNAFDRIFSSPVTRAMLSRKADSRFRNLKLRKKFCKSVIDYIHPYENDNEFKLIAKDIISKLKVE